MFLALVAASAACSPHTSSEPAGEAIAPAVADAEPATSPPAAPTLPESVPPAPMIASLSAGVHHTCAIRRGQLLCWGLGRLGILGRGEDVPEDSWTPKPVIGIAGVVEVVADYDYTCARTGDGAVHCWGDNDAGQLGVGDLDPRARPTRVGEWTAERIAAGFRRACAVGQDGARCWGTGAFGDGESRSREVTPRGIDGLAGVDDLVLGSGHACALQGGEVRCWGEDASGQLGDGEGGCRYERALCAKSRCLPPKECKRSYTPVTPLGLPPIVEIALAGSQSYFRDRDGRVWETGQVGTTMDFGADNPRYRPSVIDGLPPMVEIDAGGSHACGRTADGEVFCWGNNAFGQLGHPPRPGGGAEGPSRVPGLPPAVKLALGFYSTCAITGSGEAMEAWCWGDNGYGQLGDGTAERRHAPVRVRWE
ncbi:MAG: hypothetical protein R3B09_27630 [Nannocystaceae bacterium]